tara:strand:+ start:4778 stop:5353 length:576 start_codon:yes stop_codon:yes gene_type:complete
MKKIIILFLIQLFSFQAIIKADDIKDFEIEGISIGDSLLNFYSINEIKKNIDKNIYKDTDGKFKLVGFYGNFGQFDGMQFAFKSSDKKFIIYGINGGIFFSNFNDCKKELKTITKEISFLFENAEKSIDTKTIHPADKSRKSYAIADIFFIDSGSVSVRCTNWSDEITKKYGWSDNLRISVKTKEYNNWLE